MDLMYCMLSFISQKYRILYNKSATNYIQTIYFLWIILKYRKGFILFQYSSTISIYNITLALRFKVLLYILIFICTY